MTELALVSTALEARAWRFAFDDPEGDESPAMIIREPRHTAVTSRPVDLTVALQEPGAADDASLSLIWLPTGDAVPSDLEKSVVRWIDQSEHYGSAVRATIRTIRVIWAGSRALVYAPLDQWPYSVDAVLRFTLLARDISALEKQMKLAWSAVSKHAPLSHAISFREERLQAQVSQMTEVVTRMRVSFLQVQSAIEQTDPGLSEVSKRLCAELLLQAGIYDRLNVLGEPIQFALDHYELANTRLIDHKTASTDAYLMGIIIVLLVVQTAISIVEELLH